MSEIAIRNNIGIVPAQDLQLSLFDSFLSCVDRTAKTVQTYKTNLRQFAAWLHFNAISRPIREDIISFRDWLGSEHEAIQLDSSIGWIYVTDANGNRCTVKCKPNTVAQYLQTVKQFFGWASSMGFYPDVAKTVHAPKIDNSKHHKDALTADDVRTIEKSIAGNENATEQEKRLYAMYLLTVNAGLRTIELERANVKDLQKKGGSAFLYVWGKGHTEADAKQALAPEVYEAIADYLKSRTDKPTGNSPLFVATGNRSHGQRIAARTISQMLKAAMIKAGYNSERITAHSLRHTAGTNVYSLTRNIYTAQKYLRHASPKTTEIYVHGEEEREEEATAKQLYAFYHGQNTTADKRSQLDLILDGMSAEQLEKIKEIAEAFKK